jgi:hypothetical protein
MLQAASRFAYSFRRKQEVRGMAAEIAPTALERYGDAFGRPFGCLPRGLESISAGQTASQRGLQTAKNSCFYELSARNIFKPRKDKRLPGWEGV